MDIRFLTGFRKADTNVPGLVMEDDGTVWLVNPNGTRTQLPGGGSGSARISGMQYGPALVSGDSSDFGGGVGDWVAPAGGVLATADGTTWNPYTTTNKILTFDPSAPGQSIQITLDGTFAEGVSYCFFLLFQADPSTLGEPREVTLEVGSPPPLDAVVNISEWGIGSDLLQPVGFMWQPVATETDPTLSITLTGDDFQLILYCFQVMTFLGGLPLIGRFDGVVATPSEDWGTVDMTQGAYFSLQSISDEAKVVVDTTDLAAHSAFHQFSSDAADFTGTLIIKHAQSVFPGGLMIENESGATKFSIASEVFPADGGIANGSVYMLYDDTPGSAEISFRGRDSAGAIVTGSIPLA